MPSDPLANLVERLRGRSCQPRKVGIDLWESRCPGHGSADHALALGRSADGKLLVTCRSTENCSLSRIASKLDLKIDRLFTETHRSLLGRLQALEIQASIYKSPRPIVPALVDSTFSEAGIEPIEANTSAPGLFTDGVSFESGTQLTGASPSNTQDNESFATERGEESPKVSPFLENPALDATSIAVPSGTENPAVRGEPRMTGGVNELLSIAGCARTFRRPDGGYSLSRSVDGHTECHDLDSPDVRRWLTRAYYEASCAESPLNFA